MLLYYKERLSVAEIRGQVPCVETVETIGSIIHMLKYCLLKDMWLLCVNCITFLHKRAPSGKD